MINIVIQEIERSDQSQAGQQRDKRVHKVFLSIKDKEYFF